MNRIGLTPHTPASVSIVGYEPDELIGHSIYDFVDPEQLEFIQQEHSRILKSDEPVPVTYQFKHKDGYYIWLESSTRIYTPSKDEEPRILSISRDISERIKFEENLQNLNISLDEQQRRVRLLYELSASSNLSTDEQLAATLKAGIDNLGMDLGIISQIREEEYKVLHFVPESSGLKQGMIFDLGDTYCSIALVAEDIIAIDEMKASKYSSHPCYAAFNLESYIGVPIRVNGESFGTLNFSRSEARQSPFTDADHDFVRLMGQWVSRVLEQDNATKKLVQSEERFRALVRSAVVGVITMDAFGTVESFNDSAQQIFGYTQKEVIGKNVSLLMGSPESNDHDGFLKRYREGKGHGRIGESVEVVGRRKDGKKVYLDLGINEVRTEGSHFLTGTFRDITEMKKAADDLANAHLQLKSVFNSATQVGIIATDLEGKITIFNPGAERMLGYSSDEIIGQESDVFHLESEVKQRADELSRELGHPVNGFDTYVALAKLGGYAEMEWTYVRKDGSQLKVDSAVTATRDTSGEITGFLGITLDITQRKRGEEALRLAKSVAEEANQTKSEFLTNMSHELRTPLNSVIGFSNIILRNTESKLDAKEITYLERIQANGKHLLELINDILDLSKVEAGSMDLEIVSLNVGDLIQDLIGQVESQVAQKSVDLVKVLPEKIVEVQTDPGKLKQILLNLVSNAIKFTDEGEVAVKVETDPDSNRPISISVIDSGIGIPEDRIGHIFDEFEQVDSSTQRKYGGTGLGLAISRALCELMGYSLDVDSEIDKGSTFRISIPLDDPLTQIEESVRQSTRTSDRVSGSINDGSFKGKRILLVDDDPDSLTLLSHYLKDTECVLETAVSTSAAMKAVKRQKPDLITLDLRMPDEAGDVFLSALRENKKFADIPVVVVSIVARENRGKLPGATDFVQKPVNQHDLIWAIRRNIQNAPCCVLLVEDDPDMRNLISEYLSDLQLELRTAGNGQEALDILEDFVPNLILLDLKMPEMDGMKFLEVLENRTSHTMPRVMIITGKNLSSQEELLIKNDGIVIIRKDQDFEKELRHHMLTIFLEK
ncbi:MAG: PAS domain S-box protein [Candidatus Marinimicrobia bacterium]|nr:PAS domain S-box protein [Candidatus Neomarinimicrobiota bacterium]MBT3679212.1 PAS domain S-box protein [Candidatus Neomarinimicrobiota bacterium]MBT4131265.1 PAS domain S-box protein [Candidatus Neomarinimicrobiota bacterium]MBT4253622.1 PAS domain S-box protein [Candidatus Neomarinimicrobiota bacterium]MBT5236310.1 PAS domain S-box protein [Candidatus Neomarinimicrobiota bacterium]